MSPRRDVSMGSDEVAAFLAPARTAVLATIGKDGFPHCAAMWYVPRAGALHMWAYRKSQKAVNLLRDARCGVVVEEGAGYSQLKGVLVQARARIVYEPQAVERIGRLLYDRYTLPATGVEAVEGPIAEIRRQAAKRVGIVVPMARVASWDHSKI